MTGDIGIIHVAFGTSRARSIREALRLMGRDEPVIGLSGSFDYGPLDPPDPDIRREWIRTVLRCDPREDRPEPEAPWHEATSGNSHPVYWVCLTDPGEHACFLRFAFLMAGRPFDIVDATDLDIVTVDGIGTPWSLGLMRPGDIVAAGLAESRRPYSLIEMEVASASWAQLRRENAPLRIVRSGRLVSARLDHFDDALISQARTDWDVVAKLVGRTIHHLSFDVDPRGQGASDVVLFGRVLALGVSGGLAIRGAGPTMRDYEVCRPSVI